MKAQSVIRGIISIAVVSVALACGSTKSQDDVLGSGGSPGASGSGGRSGSGGETGSSGGAVGSGGTRQLEEGEVAYAHCTASDGTLGLKRQELDEGVLIEGDCQEAFVSTWETDRYPFAPDSVQLPLVENGSYNFIVSWGDGSYDEITDWNAPEALHKYDSSGAYEVRIIGEFVGWRFLPPDRVADEVRRVELQTVIVFGQTLADAQLRPAIALTGISQWGEMAWGDTDAQFYGAISLRINASDSPDLSQTKSMKLGLALCENVSTGVAQWDVSNVTNFSGMFAIAKTFNDSIGSWDMSSATDLSWMFVNAQTFNQPLEDWDVSSVTTMYSMFDGATQFNQPLQAWDVSSLNNSSAMFARTESFNQPLDTWDISSLTNVRGMFSYTKSFDQSLGAWDVSGLNRLPSFLSFSSISTENYGDTLVKWAQQSGGATLLEAQGVTYPASAAASRAMLVDRGWIITDGGQAP